MTVFYWPAIEVRCDDRAQGMARLIGGDLDIAGRILALRNRFPGERCRDTSRRQLIVEEAIRRATGDPFLYFSEELDARPLFGLAHWCEITRGAANGQESLWSTCKRRDMPARSTQGPWTL